MIDRICAIPTTRRSGYKSGAIESRLMLTRFFKRAKILPRTELRSGAAQSGKYVTCACGHSLACLPFRRVVAGLRRGEQREYTT
mgnify:CR=1 FL=1